MSMFLLGLFVGGAGGLVTASLARAAAKGDLYLEFERLQRVVRDQDLTIGELRHRVESSQ
jgi:hypothetical protein